MPSTETTQQKRDSARAVDEEYKKLQRFHVSSRRIVLVDDEDPPEGGFGVVRRAELHESAYLPGWLSSRRSGPPQLVAVKQIKITKMSSTPRVKRAFTREMLVWSSLEAHDGIAKFLGFYADFENSKAWLLSPWEPNGNVSEFVKKHNLEVPEKLSLIYDTIDALVFLHQLDPPVCHGDIKAANVLVGADYKARLCDFGLARLHEDSGFGRLETSTGNKGSVRWCSPELIEGAQRAPTSDVYAWAWLVWEIMTGDLPYEGTSSDYAIIRKIFESPMPEADGQARLSDCVQLWDLMTRCWAVNPQQRPMARMCKTTVMYLPRCTPTPPSADHQTRSPALLENLGDLESWKGNQDKSSAYLDEALQLYQERADNNGIASVLRKQAAAAFRVTDLVKLRTIATTALEHCRTLNDALGIAEASFYIGVAEHVLGDSEEALGILRESLKIRREHGDDVGAGQCLDMICAIHEYRDHRQEALSATEEALALASRSGDRLGKVNALETVAVLATRDTPPDYVKATEALSEAIMIARNIRWEGGLCGILLTMSSLKAVLQEYREAEECCQEAIRIARRIRDRMKLAVGLGSLADWCREQSRFNEAVPLMGERCLLLHEIGQLEESKQVASTLVELKCSQGEWDSALFWHDHIITVCRSQKEHSEVADQLERKGEILVKMQRYDEAALHFEAAIATRWENDDFRSWKRSQLMRQMRDIPKTAMTWERPLPPSRDRKKLQRRLPQLIAAALKPPTSVTRAQTHPFTFDQ